MLPHCATSAPHRDDRRSTSLAIETSPSPNPQQHHGAPTLLIVGASPGSILDCLHSCVAIRPELRWDGSVSSERQQLKHHTCMLKATGSSKSSLRLALRPSVYIHLPVPSQAQKLAHHMHMPFRTRPQERRFWTKHISSMHIHLTMSSQSQQLAHHS